MSSIMSSIYSGESGLGKSTLIQSLFLTNFFGDKLNPPAIGESVSQCFSWPHGWVRVYGNTR